MARIPALGTPGGDTPYAMGEVLASRRAVCTRPTVVSLSFELTDEVSDVFVGLRRPAEGASAQDYAAEDYAVFDACTMESHVDRDAIAARRRERFLAAVEQDFDTTGFCVDGKEGKLYLGQPPDGKASRTGGATCPHAGKCDVFTLNSAVQSNAYDTAAGRCGFATASASGTAAGAIPSCASMWWSAR